MFEDEIIWLDNFEFNCIVDCEISEVDNILLVGYLWFIKIFFLFCGVEKEMFGNYCFILYRIEFFSC